MFGEEVNEDVVMEDDAVEKITEYDVFTNVLPDLTGSARSMTDSHEVMTTNHVCDRGIVTRSNTVR